MVRHVKTARGYGRASTEKQVLSPKMQEKVVAEAFKLYKQIRPDWKDLEWGGFFCEEPTTRTSKFRERPVGSLLLAATSPGDVILVSNYDRIFGSTLDACEMIELIRLRQFQLTILDAEFDLNSNMGQACFKMAAIFKELEVHEIRRRCRESYRHRRENGMPVGGPPPVGWKSVRFQANNKKGSSYVVDDTARANALELLQKFRKFRGSKRAFLHSLDKERYRGKRKWNWVSTFREINAAIAGFPLQNGTHDPEPIPFNAVPIPTIGSPD